MTEKTGTFVITHVDSESAVVSDVSTAHVHTLSEHPDFTRGEVIEATIRPEPPMEVTWQVETIHERRTISLHNTQESPSEQAREIGADQAVGELTRRDRAGEGEIHVLCVKAGQAEQTARDILDDDATLTRAARLGVDRVETRVSEGLVSVRYLST